MKIKKLPKVLYIAIQESRTLDAWLSASETAEDAIDGDGPTVVGTYKLIESKKLVKSAREV